MFDGYLEESVPVDTEAVLVRTSSQVRWTRSQLVEPSVSISLDRGRLGADLGEEGYIADKSQSLSDQAHGLAWRLDEYFR